jgi:hypothetical protein
MLHEQQAEEQPALAFGLRRSTQNLKDSSTSVSPKALRFLTKRALTLFQFMSLWLWVLFIARSWQQIERRLALLTCSLLPKACGVMD